MPSALQAAFYYTWAIWQMRSSISICTAIWQVSQNVLRVVRPAAWCRVRGGSNSESKECFIWFWKRVCDSNQSSVSQCQTQRLSFPLRASTLARNATFEINACLQGRSWYQDILPVVCCFGFCSRRRGRRSVWTLAGRSSRINSDSARWIRWLHAKQLAGYQVPNSTVEQVWRWSSSQVGLMYLFIYSNYLIF